MRIADVSRESAMAARCPARIEFFVDGVTAGHLPDYQSSALMAIVIRGMTHEKPFG
jgi:thymidine phosphorylase